MRLPSRGMLTSAFVLIEAGIFMLYVNGLQEHIAAPISVSVAIAYLAVMLIPRRK